MKIFTAFLSILTLILVVFNFFSIDFNNPFSNESVVALITVVAGLCALILLAILRISKKIEKIQKMKS